MKRSIIVLLTLSFPLVAAATPKPKQLAQDAVAFIKHMEYRLGRVIGEGNKVAFTKNVETPTRELVEKYPFTAYGDYPRCQFMLDDFRIYAQDQFAAGGTLPKSAPSYKQYLGSKRQCAASLKSFK